MPKIKTLKQLADLKDFSKTFNTKTITDEICKSLAKEGGRIIREAYETRNWKDRSYNLYNSFVSAVIVNGKIRAIDYLGPEHAPSDTNNSKPGSNAWLSDTLRRYGKVDIERGRKEANNFVVSYAAQHRKGIILVIAATMFYAGILESNGYRVISHVNAKLGDITADGMVLKDFKIGNMFGDFKSGSDAQVKIGKEHITIRGEEIWEGRAGRSTTFWTKG
jgi:hypothetical protein